MCTFCKIVNREEPSYPIKQTMHAMAILDIYPFKEGHALVISKKHYDDIESMDIQTLKEVAYLTQWVVQRLRTNFGAEDIQVMSWHGAAVQEIRHFHQHICPEYGASVVANEDYFKKTVEKFKREVKTF